MTERSAKHGLITGKSALLRPHLHARICAGTEIAKAWFARLSDALALKLLKIAQMIA